MCTYFYDNVGNPTGYTCPNGVGTSYTYDQLIRLTQMRSCEERLSDFKLRLRAGPSQASVRRFLR